MVGVPEVVRLPSDVNLGADVGLVTARLPRLAFVVIGRPLSRHVLRLY